MNFTLMITSSFFFFSGGRSNSQRLLCHFVEEIEKEFAPLQFVTDRELQGMNSQAVSLLMMLKSGNRLESNGNEKDFIRTPPLL